MRKARVPVQNFQFGEVNSSILSRTDTQIYANSAQRLQNFFLRAEGGIVKRAGTKHIHTFTTTYDASKTQQVRLVPFIFSDDERYIIAFESQVIRCFSISTSNVVSLVATLTADTDNVVVPYTDTKLHELDFAQSGDVMFITHQTIPIKKLVRTSLTAFQLEAFTFSVDGDSSSATNQFTTNQPYTRFQSTGVTLDSNGVSGNAVTLTTSANHWVSGHVGTRVRYYGTEVLITGYTSATVVTGTVQGTLKQPLDINALRTIEGTATIEVTHAQHGLKAGENVIVSEAATIATITAGNINGTRAVTVVVDENHYRFNAASGTADASVDGGGAPIISTHAPTTEWSEQSYSSVRGYPSCVTFHENRLWFGGSAAQPDTIWSSKSNDFFNFSKGSAAANDAIELVASIGEINTIRHMVSNRDLHVFTSTSEFYLPAFSNTPITPTNAQVKRQTPFGSNFVKPVTLDGATIYCQASGLSVAEYVFTDTQAAYNSNIISTISSHLIKTPHQMVVLQGALDRPESYIYLVNNDGSLAVYTSNKYEQKAGWTEFTTNGIFSSICSVDTNLYVTAWYDTGAGTKKLMLMEFDKTKNLDCSRSYDNSAIGVYTISTDDWVNGAVLDVITANSYVGQFTVASNKVTTTSSQALAVNTSAEIGYTFPVELKTNPIDVAVEGGPLTGHPRTVNKVTVDLINASSVSVNGNRLTIRQTTDDMSLPINPVTKKVEFRLLGYSTDPIITINQTTPLPLQINGVVAEVTF